MPRLDVRVAPATVLPYELRMVLAIIQDQINALRQQAGLSPWTNTQVRQALRTYLHDHPRPGQGG
jgi:hypothetical protein